MSLTSPGENKKVLVLGASGYLGRPISNAFLDRGWRVFGWGTQAHSASFFSKLSEHPGFTYQAGDILNLKTQDLMLDCEPDAVVFCVALDQKDSEIDFKRTLEVNVRSVWSFMTRLNRRSQKQCVFVYLSTVQAYGALHGEIDENYRLKPLNAYGLTHVMAEHVAQSFCRSEFVRPLIARVSNGYGAPIGACHSCWNLVINDFCSSAIRRKKVHLLSDGSGERDFIFVDDIAHSILRLIEAAGDDSIFNVASGLTSNLLDVAREVADQYAIRFGEEIPVVNKDGDQAAWDQTRTQEPSFEISRARVERVGVSAPTPLDLGIQRVFAHLEGEAS